MLHAVDQHHIDGLVQNCSNSCALAIELLQSCIKLSISALRNITYNAYDFQNITVLGLIHKPPTNFLLLYKKYVKSSYIS